MVTRQIMRDYSCGLRPELWLLWKIFEASNEGKRKLELAVELGSAQAENYAKLLRDYGYTYSFLGNTLEVSW